MRRNSMAACGCAAALLTLALYAVPVAAQDQFAITNVHVVNVSPTRFSVLFRTDTPATPRINVFSDAAGTRSLAGSVGAEVTALDQGDPVIELADERRRNLRDLVDRVRGKGLSLLRVTGCDPGTDYYFNVSAATGGVTAAMWPPSGLQRVRTPSRNAFVPDARQLLVSVPGANPGGCVGVLEYPGAAHALASVTGDRAGLNELHFDTSHFFDGAGNNLVFSGEESFSISVYGASAEPRTTRDYDVPFGTNLVVAQSHAFISDATYLMVGMGTTSILSNVSNASVPIRVVSAMQSTSVAFEVTIPLTSLTNLVILPVAAEVGPATVEPLGADRWRITLEANAGQAIYSTSLDNRIVAHLSFSPSPDALTVLVPLQPAALESVSATNVTVSGGITQAGAVQVISRRPYAQWHGAGAADTLAVSGIPGTEYIVESSPDLFAETWEERSRFTLGAGELQATVMLPESDDTVLYIRIREPPLP